MIVIGPADFPLGPDGELPAHWLTPTATTRSTAAARSLPPNIDLRETIEHLERELIVRACEDAAGVQAEAARRLNVSRGDVGYKVRKYGIPLQDPASPPDA